MLTCFAGSALLVALRGASGPDFGCSGERSVPLCDGAVSARGVAIDIGVVGGIAVATAAESIVDEWRATYAEPLPWPLIGPFSGAAFGIGRATPVFSDDVAIGT